GETRRPGLPAGRAAVVPAQVVVPVLLQRALLAALAGGGDDRVGVGAGQAGGPLLRDRGGGGGGGGFPGALLLLRRLEGGEVPGGGPAVADGVLADLAVGPLADRGVESFQRDRGFRQEVHQHLALRLAGRGGAAGLERIDDFLDLGVARGRPV